MKPDTVAAILLASATKEEETRKFKDSVLVRTKQPGQFINERLSNADNEEAKCLVVKRVLQNTRNPHAPATGSSGGFITANAERNKEPSVAIDTALS